MDKLLKNHLKTYCRQVKKVLPYIPYRKNQFMMSLKNGVENFLQENNDADINEIYNQFGTPEELTEIYLEDVCQRDLAKYIAFHKIFKYTCSLLVVICISGCIYFIYHARNSVVEEAQVQTGAEATK